MKVKLTINLGTKDLAHYGLDQGYEGDVVEVSEKDGKKLIEKSYAVVPSFTHVSTDQQVDELDKDDPKAMPGKPVPEKIHAVPPVDLKTTQATKPPVHK